MLRITRHAECPFILKVVLYSFVNKTTSLHYLHVCKCNDGCQARLASIIAVTLSAVVLDECANSLSLYKPAKYIKEGAP